MAEYTIRTKGADRSTEFDLDSGAEGGSYNIDLIQTSWGVAEQPEPAEEVHAQGATVYLPLEEVWKRRAIRLVGWVECPSLYAKQLLKSTLTQLFKGQKTLRRQGWEIDVVGMAPVEREESMLSPLFLAYEVMLLATPPFWRMADTLDGLAYDALLFPDYGVPMGEVQPAFDFYVTAPGGTPVIPYGAITASPGSGNHLTIDNWGTAFAYPSASLSGFPASTTLYMKGRGRYRMKVTTDGAGAASLTEAARFYLEAGLNGIRFENQAGVALALGSSARINFGSTRLRYL